MKAFPSVYIACSFRTDRVVTLPRVAQLREMGVTVTSRWIDIKEWGNPLGSGDAALCALYARQDFEDIDRADAVLYFADFASIGKHVELGYACAKLKPVFIIGRANSVFCFLPNILRFETWELFVQSLLGPDAQAERLDAEPDRADWIPCKTCGHDMYIHARPGYGGCSFGEGCECKQFVSESEL